MFTPEIKFKKPWRAYQQAVLDQLDEFLSDDHLHVVSAPGSGKTVLGLEIARSLGLPSVVFTPTNSIREQWLSRLINDFLPDHSTPEWVSTDIRQPDFFTVSTYQALSAASKSDSGLKDLITQLKKQGTKVILVDEAHHLRAHWWQCLNELKDALDNPIIIALTATPPIDVSQTEWNRYSSFCGPVDIEVNVPELVRSGALCPHQDFIYLNQPTEEEFSVLDRFSTEVKKLMLDFELDGKFANCLATPSVPWIPKKQSRSYLRKNQSFFLALSIYLRNSAGRIPLELLDSYDLLGGELPNGLTLKMAEKLLHGLLYDFTDRLTPEAKKRLKGYHNRLLQIGALEKKHVGLRGNNQMEKILKSSPAKLHSVSEIIESEFTAQGRKMRAVILADYIRKEALDAHTHRDEPLAKLGVAPIFELLRRMRLRGISLAMLTGSIVIIPRAIESMICEHLEQFQISEINFTPLPQDESYAYLEVKGSEETQVVLLLTSLFEDGILNCLVGTAALLGEGWDAPSLNTLILATYVGSFVMSNQMRGRSMRRDPDHPDKVANIWHLATIAPDTKGDALEQEDLKKLNKRFDHFYGIGQSEQGACISSGLGRIDLAGISDFQSHNEEVLKQAEKRESIANLWDAAFSDIPKDRFLRPIREVRLPRKIVTTTFITRLIGKKDSGIRQHLGRYLQLKRLNDIALTVFELLKESEAISSKLKTSQINASIKRTRALVSLTNASEKDQKVFVESLQQCFNPFYPARYFMAKEGEFVMVPKQLKPESFKRSLVGIISRYKLYSTQSYKGQKRLVELRQGYLLEGEESYLSDQVKKWH